MNNNEDDKGMQIFGVQCHCGRVRGKFQCHVTSTASNNDDENQTLPSLIAWDCNCSDCAMRRNVHLIVPERDFWLDMPASSPPQHDKNPTTTTNSSSNIPSCIPSRNEPPSNGMQMTKIEKDQHPNDERIQQARLEEATTLYQWGTGTAQRRFCKVCGILPWYRPRSNPNGYGITIHCVDWTQNGQRLTPPTLVIQPFDGVHWQDTIAAMQQGQTDVNITTLSK